ncbi:unnamed protein product [marine sediment metagenome]|uniref:Uncharacterized protein n=1 Tax=marine sediment metagenome TaxID=412755 RepID=X1CDU5_9ZZZZ
MKKIMSEEKVSNKKKKRICLIDNYSSSFQTERIERIVNIIQEKNLNIELTSVLI